MDHPDTGLVTHHFAWAGMTHQLFWRPEHQTWTWPFKDSDPTYKEYATLDELKAVIRETFPQA